MSWFHQRPAGKIRRKTTSIKTLVPLQALQQRANDHGNDTDCEHGLLSNLRPEDLVWFRHAAHWRIVAYSHMSNVETQRSIP